MGDVNIAAFDQLRHLAEEEGQEQNTDVRAIDVRIGHNDDLVVAETFEIERALAFAVTDAGADRGDHGANFVILEHLVQTSFLDVDDLTAQRQDRLVVTVTALLGRATCRVALDDEEFGVFRVAARTVGQLAGKSATGEGGLANSFAGLAGRFAGAGGGEALLDDLLGDARVGVEELHQSVVGAGGDDAFDFGRNEFHLGLRFEAGVRVLDGNDRHETFAHVVTGDRRVFFLQQIVRLGVLVDRTGQGRAEADHVRATVRVGDGVCEAEDLVVVRVVVLHDHVNDHLVLFTADDNRLGMDDGLVLAKLFDEFLDAVAVKEPFDFDFLGSRRLARSRSAGGCFFGSALVLEDDFDAGIEECQFAQAIGQEFELELGGDGENFRIGLKGNQRSVAFALADDFEFAGGFAALEFHRVDLAVAVDFDGEPFRKGVDALGADAVQTAGVFIGALPEFTARMQIGQHQLDGRHLELRVNVDRNTAAIVTDGAGAVYVDGDVDPLAKTGQMFVDGIVENFENAMVKTTFIDVADIHSRPLADGFQSLQFIDLGGIVF